SQARFRGRGLRGRHGLRAPGVRPKPSEVAMWKFVLILLTTALAVLVAQLIADAPVIQTRVGVTIEAPALAYAGVRG
ncbi:MAG: hypothetical protein WBB50_03030, partial [Methyloceanibacter sp.]